MRQGTRSPSRSTGWKSRTRVESPLVRGANHVFANANAPALLHTCSFFSRCFSVPYLGGLLIFVRRGESQQLSKARFIRFARRTITVGLDPLGMFDAQGVMYLSLKLSVRAGLIRHLVNSVC